MTKKNSNRKQSDPRAILRNRLVDLLLQPGYNGPLPDDIPSKWEKHGDLVLFPSWSFRQEIWLSQSDKVWDIVAETLKCKRVARKNSVCNDNFRSPRVEILKGHNCWVLHIDNKIKYTYDVTKCMFSAGNISEKLRIAQLSCQGEIVVDLYAGIGYFTLPFLIHAGAAFVHACEWNPFAVEALSKNLSLNGVNDKCIIHYGDNKEVCPANVADRVNLGLIPSSEEGWNVACKALKVTGGILHIHGNVTSQSGSLLVKQSSSNRPLVKSEWMTWANYVCFTIQKILCEQQHTNWETKIQNIIRIKSYAPHIDHLVIDIICTPCEVKKEIMRIKYNL